MNRRLEILDMIDERLFKMKELAQKVINEDLTKREVNKINKKVQKLKEEVNLLEKDSTDFS